MSKLTKAFLWVSLKVSIAFFTIYGFTNWRAESAPKLYHFYFDWEKNIPFIPSWIVVYESMNLILFMPLFFSTADEVTIYGKRLLWVTLIAGLIFYFFPAPIAFIRPSVIPGWQASYDLLFKLDKVYNTFPSLHVTYSLLTVMSFWGHLNQIKKFVFGGWFLAICLSVSLTHQHHVLDIVSGIILASAAARMYPVKANQDVYA